jgi:2-methylisocitrate lyase-like PEP mutase family enzyme
MNQQDRARRFREMHTDPPVVLPNAWDALSACAMERAGARAIATTSGGVSWAHGRPDGQGLSREEMSQAVARIARAVSVPVTADVEGGYGFGSTADVAETVEAVIAAGAVGINLEDAPGHGGDPLLPAPVHAERIAAARATAWSAGLDLFINARTDVYLRAVGEPEERFDHAVERANAYLAAGADCAFIPGVVDLELIALLAKAVRGPLNVLAGPHAPTYQGVGPRRRRAREPGLRVRPGRAGRHPGGRPRGPREWDIRVRGERDTVLRGERSVRGQAGHVSPGGDHDELDARPRVTDRYSHSSPPAEVRISVEGVVGGGCPQSGPTARDLR